jgi:hypothetical protein
MKKAASKSQRDDVIGTLEARFEQHPERHRGLGWTAVQERLEARPDALKVLAEMERTGGEPDVIAWDKKTGELVFCDCAPESPAGRRSVCYDREALDARKANKPKTSALDLAAAIGIEMLDEAGYRALQKLGPFDTKTSSWVKTPPSVRALGGALFCDYRYGQVFTYHNGAESYYAVRGFRGTLRV